MPMRASCFRCEKSGNAQFARDVAAWTFQEKLVLRIDSATHHFMNEPELREHYTINENLAFEPTSPGTIPRADGCLIPGCTTSSSSSPCSTRTSALRSSPSRASLACTTPLSASPTVTACSNSYSTTAVVTRG